MYALAAALYRLSFRGLYAELYVRPNRCAAAGALGENSRDDPNFYFTQYRSSSDLARSWRVVAPLLCRRVSNTDTPKERGGYNKRTGGLL